MSQKPHNRARAPDKFSQPLHSDADALTVFPASEARANFNEVMGRVRYGRERLVITSKGKPAAALVTMDDLKLLQLLDDQELRRKLYVGKPEEEEYIDLEDYVQQFSQ